MSVTDISGHWRLAGLAVTIAFPAMKISPGMQGPQFRIREDKLACELCAVCFKLTARQKKQPICLCEQCASRLARSMLTGSRRYLLPPPGHTEDQGLSPYQLVSLFFYTPFIRGLVLGAKVKGDHRALAILRQLFMGHPDTRAALDGVDMLAAAPSSLWGRLRGRFDLAAALASDLARVRGQPLQAVPSELFWRLKKRALVTGRKKTAKTPLRIPVAGLRRPASRPGTSDEEHRPSVPILMVIDDVVTTGTTLCNAARAVQAQLHPCEIRLLALANAM